MKERKLFYRVAAALFALVFSVIGCIESTEYVASEISGSSIYQKYIGNYTYAGDFNYNLENMPKKNYSHYAVFYHPQEEYFYCFFFDSDTFSIKSKKMTYSSVEHYVYQVTSAYCRTANFSKFGDVSSGSAPTQQIALINTSDGTESAPAFQMLYVCSDVSVSVDDVVVSYSGSDSYNSALGFLQNINRQTLYLEDDAFSAVYETLKYQFTYDKLTTTGLDLTDGTWSVRHYMQVEVKNSKNKYETVDIYDKVLMGEYPAASCKIGYMYKDSLEKLHGESGFNGLSWWESNGLGYITYYNDYFQLVRTNSDGSVEYGGYVKVWQDEYNINHSTTLGEDESPDNNGYNDNIVSGSHGSGGTYEDAEHDANENASNAADSNSEFTEQMNDMVSMVSAVPQLFAALFSFLPDWCLNLLAAGVGFGVILLIWKAARG